MDVAGLTMYVPAILDPDLALRLTRVVPAGVHHGTASSSWRGRQSQFHHVRGFANTRRRARHGNPSIDSPENRKNRQHSHNKQSTTYPRCETTTAIIHHLSSRQKQADAEDGSSR